MNVTAEERARKIVAHNNLVFQGMYIGWIQVN